MQISDELKSWKKNFWKIIKKKIKMTFSQDFILWTEGHKMGLLKKIRSIFTKLSNLHICLSFTSENYTNFHHHKAMPWWWRWFIIALLSIYFLVSLSSFITHMWNYMSLHSQNKVLRKWRFNLSWGNLFFPLWFWRIFFLKVFKDMYFFWIKHRVSLK